MLHPMHYHYPLASEKLVVQEKHAVTLCEDDALCQKIQKYCEFWQKSSREEELYRSLEKF